MIGVEAKLEKLKGMISEGSIPRYLCKYRPIYKDDVEKSLVKMLKDSTLWFSTHDKFNDPFDYKINAEADCTKEELFEFYLSRLGPEYRGDLKFAVVNAVEQLYKSPQNLKEFINGILRDATKNDGICCFSHSAKNILQWSYYADSHKGVCLVYDILKDPDLFWTPLEVKYFDEYPIFNFIKEPEELVKKGLRAKAKIWEHEGEFRVIKPGKNGSFMVDKSALVTIILGCQIDEDIKNSLLKDVVDFGYSEKFYFTQAKTSKTKYELEFDKIITG